MLKPRIKRFKLFNVWMWKCYTFDWAGYGKTIKQAYWDWQYR